MRVYGRVYNADGTYTWQTITTDQNGNNDAVYLTALLQCLKMGLGESPMYSTYGIPARQAVATQVPPDYYTNLVVSKFQPYFAMLSVTAIDATDGNGVKIPAYLISAVSHSGAVISMKVPQ